MTLPSNVTEAYLQGSRPEIRKFWTIVARRAPKDIQSQVSEFTSEVSDGKCIFRDRDGEVLHETPNPPPPVKPENEYRNLQVEALDKRLAQTRQLGLSSAGAVVQLAEMAAELFERVKDLETSREGNLAAVRDVQGGISTRLKTVETQTTGLQAKVDREGRGVFFSGTWQPAIDYANGAIVTHGKRAYVAIKSVRAGGEVPSRDGSGWTPLFDAAQIPGGPHLENVADEVVGVIREVTSPLKDRLASLENEIALIHAQIKSQS